MIEKEKSLLPLENFEISVEGSIFLRNLLIYPLKYEGRDVEIETVDYAMAEHTVDIRDRQVINEVELSYRGDIPLFILQGEELVGALQNRVVNTSVLVIPDTITVLPVSCAEEGRWDGEEEFTFSLGLAYPSLRADISSSVNMSLSINKGYISDQERVWNSIRRKLTRLKVSSQTSSMHDLYTSLEEYLCSYTDGVDFDRDTAGFIAYAGGRFLGLDIFGSKRLFFSLKEKLIKSYALDALEMRTLETKLLDVSEVERNIRETKDIPFNRYDAIGRGEEYRGETKDRTVELLRDNKQIIHLSVLAKRFS